MRKDIMTANRAVAEAVKLAKPQVVPVYPITPQTTISEYLAQFVADGDLDAEYIRVESEHSAMSATLGASQAGVRAFTATSSQGLLYMHEVVYAAAGMRAPIVMADANRAISSPLNIWNDQQDSIVERDAGWIQIYVESAQEAFDSIIMGYKIAENENCCGSKSHIHTIQSTAGSSKCRTHTQEKHKGRILLDYSVQKNFHIIHNVSSLP